MSDRQRLFLALMPEEEHRQILHELARELASITGGRVIPQQNLHMTLRFLGRIDQSKRECIESVADSIHAISFDLDFNEFARRRNMVWAVAPDSPRLLSLVNSLQQIDSVCGMAAADHSFSAHITLIRDATRMAAQLPQIAESVHCGFSEFLLMQSQTLPQGSQYSVVRRWPLK